MFTEVKTCLENENGQKTTMTRQRKTGKEITITSGAWNILVVSKRDTEIN